MNTADQCRAMGLSIGDTIEGTEGCGTDWESTARLTLIWLGETEVVFRVRERIGRHGEWSEPRESANWTLSCRYWRKL